MTALRLISFPAHAALEFGGGLALMVAPFVFGFTAAGLVVTVGLGALIAGLALTAASRDAAAMAIAGHFAVDRAVTLALAAGALTLAAHGDRSAAIALLAGAATQLILTSITRYSARS